MISEKNDAKKVFWKKGTCSRSFAYLLNREFGHPSDPEERAADPLAGGILQEGHQCGMLWGSALAVGAEALRRSDDPNKAVGLAMHTSKKLVDSFKDQTSTIQCREITNCNFKSRWSYMKYMFSGKFLGCFRLAENWAPEASQSAFDGLSKNVNELPDKPISCASKVINEMGGNVEEMVMVSGFAGGLGLSGNACGALSAAVWKRSLEWNKDNPGKSTFFNQKAKQVLESFQNTMGSKIQCSEICGQTFHSIEEHSEYIRKGGCKELIETLARS